MAIYHCSAHNIARSSGRTATAAAAYRAGEKIHDQKTGLTHDYRQRQRNQAVVHTQIVSPLGIEIDRSELWNLAEQREKRADARTAKEFVIALPHELPPQERQTAAVEFAQYLVNRYGCIADVALHAPSSKSDDKRNHHAHILLTTRKAVLDPHQKLALTDKIDLELSNAKRKQLGLTSSTKEMVQIRQSWAQIANTHLEQAGLAERIDHRSHQEIGNSKQAQIHETPQVTTMKRKGIPTEISRINDERKAHNAQIDRQNAQEYPTEPQKKTQSDLLAKAQERLQKRLQEREQAKRPTQALEQQKQHNHDIGFER